MQCAGLKNPNRDLRDTWSILGTERIVYSFGSKSRRKECLKYFIIGQFHGKKGYTEMSRHEPFLLFE